MKDEETPADSAPQPPDRRTTSRFDVDEHATLLLVSHGSRMLCQVIDISLGGCRLRTGDRYRAGVLVRVEVDFRVRGLAFRLGGLTQWTDGRNLVGIRFTEMSSRKKEELAEALGEIEEKVAAKAQEEAALAQANAKQDSGEEDEEAALPESVQMFVVPSSFMHQPHSSSAPTSVSTAASVGEPENAIQNPEPDEEPSDYRVDSGPSNLLPFAVRASANESPDANVQKRERRAQTRQDVDTSAVIHLINIASRQNGRILDLSLGGCRIYTDEPFPVGIYTRVETEFKLEGLPFRLGGVVQGLHDRRNVGIRFLDMSPRKREQLESLIAEIEEARQE